MSQPHPIPDDEQEDALIACPCCGQEMRPSEAIGPAIDGNKPYTLPLARPVMQGSNEITELVFQPMVSEHINHLKDGATFGDLFEAARKQCGQPPSVMKKLGAEDSARVVEVVSVYMLPFQRIGAKRQRT